MRRAAAVRIRPGDPARDADRIRQLTEASKAYWGYDRQLVRDWAAGLDLSAGSGRWGELYVAESDGQIVGWVGLVPRGQVCELDDLWVDPASIRSGMGSALFRFAASRALELGARTMEWGADPNAVGFYERMGGRVIGEQLSAWGRMTPRMSIDIAPEPNCGRAGGRRSLLPDD